MGVGKSEPVIAKRRFTPAAGLRPRHVRVEATNETLAHAAIIIAPNLRDAWEIGGCNVNAQYPSAPSACSVSLRKTQSWPCPRAPPPLAQAYQFQHRSAQKDNRTQALISACQKMCCVGDGEYRMEEAIRHKTSMPSFHLTGWEFGCQTRTPQCDESEGVQLGMIGTNGAWARTLGAEALRRSSHARKKSAGVFPRRGGLFRELGKQNSITPIVQGFLFPPIRGCIGGDRSIQGDERCTFHPPSAERNHGPKHR
ncbi:hypothetical protein BJV74DRAFT_798346 [Russula compacta]|nr:hypothetical protein BJV74DRAFT_798346 [Russula compacta]